MPKPPTPVYPNGRIVGLHELTADEIAEMTKPLPPSPDDYNFDDLDDDGKRIR